jgi:hypothetical protein
LPPAQGRLVLALFLFVELAAPLIVPVPSLRRFSRLSLERRTAALRRWRSGRWAPLRLVGDALKAALSMVYLSHPLVSAFLGEYKTCARPADGAAMRHDPQALVRLRVTG